MNRSHTPRNTARHLTVAAAAFLALGSGALGDAPADAATLRPNVVVHGDTVRLRDIFDGAGKDAETVLFRAPAPGQSIVLPGKWLHKVARAFHLDWHPGPGLAESRVERSSNRIGSDMIVQALTDALKRRIGPTRRFDVTLDNPYLDIHLPAQQPAAVVVKSLSYDPRSNRFAAMLMAPDDRAGAASVQVAGRVHDLIAVPILKTRVNSGDTIRARNVETAYRRADALERNVATAPEDIIGKSARRTLPRGRPVSSGDVREPQMVSRGSMVVMTYKTPNMSITAQGIARENGTRGDTVRVRNTNSGKIIEAVVTGPDTVSVQPLVIARRR